LFDLNDFAILVKAALGTDTVLQARLLAVGASAGLRHPQRVVCTTFASAGFGMATFWIWHNYSLELFNS
jgi:hypothetical protein